jgi:hypothetical protein
MCHGVTLRYLYCGLSYSLPDASLIGRVEDVISLDDNSVGWRLVEKVAEDHKAIEIKFRGTNNSKTASVCVAGADMVLQNDRFIGADSVAALDLSGDERRSSRDDPRTMPAAARLVLNVIFVVCGPRMYCACMAMDPFTGVVSSSSATQKTAGLCRLENPEEPSRPPDICERETTPLRNK